MIGKKSLKWRGTKPIGNKWREQQLCNSEGSLKTFQQQSNSKAHKSGKKQTGRISKVILGTANKNTREAIGLNQWKK